MAFKAPNSNRVREGRHATDERFGNNGAFIAQLKHGQTVYVIASDGGGWEQCGSGSGTSCPGKPDN